MSNLITEIGLCSGPPAGLARQPPARTKTQTAGAVGENPPLTEGFLAMSRQDVAEALTTAGFLGFNVARREALRRFAQSAAEGGTSDVDVTINYVRAALSEHGFCSLTSSGTEKIQVFVEPNNQQTGGPATAIDPAAIVEAAGHVAAQAASQIQEQPQTAQEAQAHVSADVAVKLLT